MRERVEMAFTAMSASAGLAPNVPRVCRRASKPGRLRGRAFRIPRAAESDGAGGGLWYVDEEQREMFASKWDRPVLRVGAEGQTLPLPEMRIVDDKKMQKVEFVSATEDAEDCPPPDGLPEVAVIGRSNVGKSSLLNLLTKGKSGALVSSKPGTTQHINHYLVANKWWIVDLPGYGFAEASQESTEMWEKFTKDYFTTRANLAGVLLLVDASIPPMDKDLEYADWLITHNVPFTVVHTKCDRDKPGMPSVDENREALRLLLDEKWHRLPSMIPTSSVSQDGREDVLKFISSIILFRRKRNADAKEAKRRAKVKARKAAKPLKQKHRERKPKPGGDGEAGDERDEWTKGTTTTTSSTLPRRSSRRRNSCRCRS